MNYDDILTKLLVKEAFTLAFIHNVLRLRTLTEREEDRLLYGQEYQSYPEGTDTDEEGDEEWKRGQRESHPQHGLRMLSARQGPPDEVPYKPQGLHEQNDIP